MLSIQLTLSCMTQNTTQLSQLRHDEDITLDLGQRAAPKRPEFESHPFDLRQVFDDPERIGDRLPRRLVTYTHSETRTRGSQRIQNELLRPSEVDRQLDPCEIIGVLDDVNEQVIKCQRLLEDALALVNVGLELMRQHRENGHRIVGKSFVGDPPLDLDAVDTLPEKMCRQLEILEVFLRERLIAKK